MGPATPTLLAPAFVSRACLRRRGRGSSAPRSTGDLLVSSLAAKLLPRLRSGGDEPRVEGAADVPRPLGDFPYLPLLPSATEEPAAGTTSSSDCRLYQGAPEWVDPRLPKIGIVDLMNAMPKKGSTSTASSLTLGSRGPGSCMAPRADATQPQRALERWLHAAIDS